ncbi:MAG: DUF2779 domain-containing protein [Elusimicrobia bacterium]|nr:DUF2779 domain-containing protein [Elusimicrobiota bacterium]
MQCPKALWLYRHAQGRSRKLDPFLQRIFEQGREVGELARDRFPDGTLIEEDHRHLTEALASTQKVIEAGACVLYEAAFMAHGVLVRPDIMVLRKGAWTIYEVKCSSEVKDTHLQDATIQRFVVEEAGLKVSAAAIVHMNGSYLRKGALDLDKLFIIADVTKETGLLKHGITDKLEELAKLLSSQKPPSTELGPWCSSPHGCDFYDACWEDIPEYSIYDIKHLPWEKTALLRQNGIMAIKDIPEDFPLSPQQALQRLAEKNQQTLIDDREIAKHLAKLKYPLHYLDFETISPAIPPYDDHRPLEQLPFQASVHIQDEPGAALRHLEYLGDGTGDPRPGLTRFLTEAIASRGSVIAYNKQFEGMCLRVLAEHYPEHSKKLLSMKERLWDSAESFSKSHYVHPGFKGRWSIKKVLPVLVPEMTYSGMAVANGEDAQTAYFQLMSDSISKADRARLMADLKEYCGQDTLAMVRLVDVLKKSVP